MSVGVSIRLFSISTKKIADNRNLQMTQIYHSDKVRTEQLHKQNLNLLFSSTFQASYILIYSNEKKFANKGKLA